MVKRGLLSTLLLYPLSRLYGMGVGIRNLMFNKGFLEQTHFDVPVITIGNLNCRRCRQERHIPSM